MKQRMQKELELLRKYYPEIEYNQEGHWFCIPSYPLQDGWNRDTTEIAFRVKNGYPGTPPYAFFVPKGLKYDESKPKNYKENPNQTPPFKGNWGCISWSHTSDWNPTSSLKTGSNLLNWVSSFKKRFEEGV